MTVATLMQALVESGGHTKELYGLAGIFVTQLGIYFANNRKGKSRDRGAQAGLEEVHSELTALGKDVRDLKSYVIGPDGQNGLRGDVRALTLHVETLRDDVTTLQIAQARNSQGGQQQ